MDRSVTNRFIIPIGLGSSILMLMSVYDADGNFSPLTDNGTYYLPITMVCLLSLVYFVTDFVMMIVFYKPGYNVYFMHHLIGIMGVSIVYTNHYYLIKYLLSYLTYEVSTIFLNISAIYRRNKIINFFSKMSDFLFVMSYTIIRILFGTYLLSDLCSFIILFGRPTAYIVIIPIALQMLNYYWFYKIILMTISDKKSPANE